MRTPAKGEDFGGVEGPGVGLLWLEKGEIEPYEFPENTGKPGPSSISGAFDRLMTSYVNDEDARPVMLAEQIMTRSVVTVREDDSLQEALELMTTHRFRHLPVAAEPGPRLLGVLSDRDGLVMISDLSERELSEATVADAMSTELITALPGTEIPLLAQTMVEYRISCLPILNEDELLVGIVTTTDVLHSIACHAPLDLWL